MKYLRLALRRTAADAHPLHRAVMERADIDGARLLQWRLRSDEPANLVAFDGTRAAVDAVLDAAPFVASYHLGDSADPVYAWVRQSRHELEPSLVAAFTRERLLAVPPIAFGVDGVVRVTVVGPADALRTALAAAAETARVDVERVGDYREGGGRGAEAATDRQRDAARTALRMGYFDVPRRASLDEVAAELGCARSTASERVRKAARTAVASAFDDRAVEE